ncbi:polysaccharide biosynthesis C-terminal domain-containing protein [Paenibacillus sp. 19GGS1-52]|uniref:lipopolysaccharide biosynthesis protein n=1 Tax=Paenibacillus sp. 19GGS1-52 TaxID=2758563 RepID=UPI001EFA4895|nr:polysaccharide biosynthesis C-terminal domain-containing protein [Paenibacillus sp. 19GGS1-52]ULO08642.1 polysaccharide biosynthesis C-terminal domain-containing protein [Paenibacillus sp. 19GGS1-52]
MNLIRSAIKYIPGTLIPALLTLISTAIFTNLLDTSEYGYFMLAMSVINILTAVSAEWLKQSIARYLPGVMENEKILKIKSSIFLSVIYILILFIFVSIIAAPLFMDKIHLYVFIVILTILNIIYFILLVILQSELKSGLYSIFNLILSIFKLAFPIILIYKFNESVNQILLGYILALIFIIIPMFINVKIRIRITIKSYKDPVITQYIKSFVKYGLPMIMFFLSAQLLNSGDRFIIQIFYGADQVGIYSANYSLIYGGIGLISTPIMLAVSPMIMRLKISNRNSEVQGLISKMTTYYLAGAIPFIVLIFLLGNDAVSILLDHKFATSNYLIGIISIGFVLWQLSMYGHKVYEVSDKTLNMMIYSIITAVANIVINFLLVPSFGLIGAAWATSLSYFIYCCLVYFGSKKFFLWKISWDILINIFIALIIGLLVILILFLIFNNDSILFKMFLCFVFNITYLFYLMLVYRKKVKRIYYNKFKKGII